MTGAQAQFDYAQKDVRTKRARWLAYRMIKILAARKCWTTRAEFSLYFGFSEDGRECRLGCAAAGCRIVFGPKGYQLMRDCTLDEIRAGRNAIYKPILKAQAKLINYDKRAHAALAKKGMVL